MPPQIQQKVPPYDSEKDEMRQTASPLPDWLRVKAPRVGAFSETKRLMRDLDLVTVCEEAACPTSVNTGK